MDWFLLLAPLILLPIVLLFVFVGCTLPRAGTKSTCAIRFSYGALTNQYINELNVQFKVIDFPFTVLRSLQWQAGQLLLEGETVDAASTDLDAEGNITCECDFDIGPGKLVLTKKKIADEDLEFSFGYEKAEVGPGGPHLH